MGAKGRMTPHQPKRAWLVPPSLPTSLTVAVLPRDDLSDEAAASALHLKGLDMSTRQARLVDVDGCLFEATSHCVWGGVRGVSSLNGATIVHGSPLDAHAFMVATATGLGIRLGDPADYPEGG